MNVYAFRPRERIGALEASVGSLARTQHHRDPYTFQHAQRAAALAVGIAGLLGLADERREALRLAALVHDIGKVALPSEILHKPGRLTGHEFAIIQSHVDIGCDILRELRSPLPIAAIVQQHHERLDGSGYPRKLIGSAIGLEGRILAVADVFDSMTANRPYRPGLPEAIALAELTQMAGQQLDRDAVDACLLHVLQIGGPAIGAVRTLNEVPVE